MPGHRTHSGVCHSDMGVMMNRYVGMASSTPSIFLHSRVSRSSILRAHLPDDKADCNKSWFALPAPTQPGQVGGHEGVGKIVKLGPGSEAAGVKVGERVGIKWVNAICGSCRKYSLSAYMPVHIRGRCKKDRLVQENHMGT